MAHKKRSTNGRRHKDARRLRKMKIEQERKKYFERLMKEGYSKSNKENVKVATEMELHMKDVEEATNK